MAGQAKFLFWGDLAGVLSELLNLSEVFVLILTAFPLLSGRRRLPLLELFRLVLWTELARAPLVSVQAA